MFRRLVVPLAALLVAAVPAAPQVPPSGVALTIYSHDLAFVRETRTLDFRAGRDTVRLAGVPDRIDVSSVRLQPGGKTRVVRLAYRFDVAQGDRILELSRGRRVRVSLRGDRVVEGTLLSADGGTLTIRTTDGAVEALSRGSVDDVRVPDPPSGLAFEPTLEAVVENASGRAPAELSYLTGGLSWSAEHTLVRDGESAAQWSTAVTIENTSGRGYDVAKLSLVAGDPNRAGPTTPPMPVMMRSMAVSGAEAKSADFAEQGFSEYHLYTLDRPAQVRDRESQVLSMLEARSIRVTPRYLARPGAGVAAQLEVKNTAAAGLGVPLPGGRVRFYERDGAGDLHFTGETTIRHTPEDETLTLDVGTAFDLVAERREVYNKRISDREREYQVEVKLRNRKKTAVSVVVEEPVAGDHEVIQKSHEPTRKDANTLQFTLPVAAGKEAVLTYTVRVRY
jgi:hypothetical protein